MDKRRRPARDSARDPGLWGADDPSFSRYAASAADGHGTAGNGPTTEIAVPVRTGRDEADAAGGAQVARPASLHLCAAGGCGKPIDGLVPFCRAHWSLVPLEIKGAIERFSASDGGHAPGRRSRPWRAIIEAVQAIGRIEADPPLPPGRCRVGGCLIQARGPFCMDHVRQIREELREELERCLAPGGNVRRAWELIDQAQAELEAAS